MIEQPDKPAAVDVVDIGELAPDKMVLSFAPAVEMTTEEWVQSRIDAWTKTPKSRLPMPLALGAPDGGMG